MLFALGYARAHSTRAALYYTTYNTVCTRGARRAWPADCVHTLISYTRSIFIIYIHTFTIVHVVVFALQHRVVKQCALLRITVTMYATTIYSHTLYRWLSL